MITEGHDAPCHGSWISVVTHLDPKYGGLSAVVPEFAAAAEASGNFRVELAGFCAPDENFVPPGAGSAAVSHWPMGRLRWMRDAKLKADFCERLRASDGIHIHGLWAQSTDVAARLARELRKPYIISAHGMLEPWALAHKRIKKQIYAALSERRNVEGAACLHALTQAEAEDYRRFGSRRPIAVIPNGVHLPASLNPDAFLAAFPGLAGKQLVLFLGRIHYKKGLELLVKAWTRLAPIMPDAHLVLAGPDSENTRSAIEKLITDSGMASRVSFTGMLHAELKWSALAAAHCFVLPSYSEGLSVSVLEAMAAGLPVIVTRQCKLPEVKLAEAGWEIEPDIDQLLAALSESLRQGEPGRRQMGNNGRALAKRTFAWDVVARQISELYAWVQGGALPQSVDLQIEKGARL